MDIIGLDEKWIAIAVARNRELPVSAALGSAGYETLVPQKENSLINGTKPPLFPGYIFLRFDAKIDCSIIRIPGVRYIVSFGGHVVPLQDDEANNLRIIAITKPNVRLGTPLQLGDMALIDTGPLKGLKGIVRDIRNSRRVVVMIPFFNSAIEVTLSSNDILSVVSN
jgi:transcriptional antiterminator NusG